MANETSEPAGGKAASVDTAKSAETRPTTQQTTPPPAAPSADETQLTKGQWLERARGIFRVSPHAIAGALHDKADDETLTEDDVRGALDEFSVREGLS
jgi:hypothetical protein